jgi:hypothetical protein
MGNRDSDGSLLELCERLMPGQQGPLTGEAGFCAIGDRRVCGFNHELALSIS